eukprot:6470223-Amphidinium_carterae.3
MLFILLRPSYQFLVLCLLGGGSGGGGGANFSNHVRLKGQSAGRMVGARGASPSPTSPPAASALVFHATLRWVI